MLTTKAPGVRKGAVCPSSLLVLVTLMLALTGCGFSPAGSQPEPGAKESLPNAPAVTQPTVSPLDTSQWAMASATTGGVRYAFRYPPGWDATLTYCAPGAATDTAGFHPPAGCAVTDILAGPKVRSLGVIEGESFTVNGKRAIKSLDSNPRSGLASAIYTVLVYDNNGTPLFGLVTSVAPGTDAKTEAAILSAIDMVAGTITAEPQP